jgi:hypothetical protein
MASLCLLLVLVPLSAGAEGKKAKRKAPEFSTTDPKETLLWLASIGKGYHRAIGGQSSNQLAQEKKHKAAREKYTGMLSQAVGKEITWHLAVGGVSHKGIGISSFGVRGLATVTVSPNPHGVSVFDHEGDEDWLLSLEGGDVVKVVGEVKGIMLDDYPDPIDGGYRFTIVLKNAVVKPKD